MLTVIWKFIRSICGFFLRLLYPLKRVVCRRRKLSTSDSVELTSIGTGDGIQIAHSFRGLQQDENEAEVCVKFFVYLTLLSHEEKVSALMQDFTENPSTTLMGQKKGKATKQINLKKIKR